MQLLCSASSIPTWPLPAPRAPGLKPCQTCLMLKRSSLLCWSFLFSPSVSVVWAFFLFSFLRTLSSVHLSHYGLAISSGVENEVLISLLINLSSPEVPESLPASQNDDWHFYLFGEISVGAKLNFNGSCIPPVRGAIHY